jgi:hypothetical protein
MTTSASHRYRQASTRLEEAVDDLVKSSQTARPHVDIATWTPRRRGSASPRPVRPLPIALVKP